MANNNQKMREYTPLGVVSDLPGSDIDDEQYSHVENMLFDDGAAIGAAGYSPMVPTLLNDPLIISTVRTPTVYYWIYAGANGVGVHDGNNDFDITPVAGVNGGVGDWTIASINNLPMVCSGQVDPPWYWDMQTGNPLQPLPNFPANTTASFIRTFKNFAIVGDILDNGTRFENKLLWSDPVEPGQVPSDWSASPADLAGDNVLASTEGALVDGIALRDQFLLFKNHSTYSMRLTGGVGVFAFSKLFTTIGLLGRNCAAEYRALVYMFTDGDMMVTDGHSINSMSDQVVRRTVFDEMDTDNVSAAFVQLWREEDQILFCYPTIGNTYCNRAAVFHTISNSWGFRDLPNVTHMHNGLSIGDIGTQYTWDTLPYPTWPEWTDSAWVLNNVNATNDKLVMSEVSGSVGELLAVGKIASTNPAIITSVVEKTAMDLGDENRLKIINEVWLNVNNFDLATTLEVRLGTQSNKWDSVKWGIYRPYDVLTQNKLDIFASGKYISISIRSRGVNNSKPRIQGYRFRYRLGGRY